MILYTVKILPNTDVVQTEVRQTRRGCEWARGWVFKTGRTDLVFGRSGQTGRDVTWSAVLWTLDRHTACKSGYFTLYKTLIKC